MRLYFEGTNCKILNGQLVATNAKEYLRKRADAADRRMIPKLAIISVGNDPASKIYMKNKRLDCEECGFDYVAYEFTEDVPEHEIVRTIRILNKDESCHGIIVQLPLPKRFCTRFIINQIDPKKDVDCLTDANIGAFYSGTPTYIPCTPKGIMDMLQFYEINVSGMVCAVIGRSNIVGKPMAQLLLQNNATVIQCHSKTQNLPYILKQADLIISATGHRDLIAKDMLCANPILIDVGMNRDENGKLCGDMNVNVREKASYATPVPGGVGPMTRAALMSNVFKAFKLH